MTTRIGSGARQHKVEIREAIETTATSGEISRDFHLKKRVWGRVVTLSAKELDVAAQITPEATHKVTIPFVRGLTEQMQFRVRDNIFGIEAIDNRNLSDVELVCLCKEVK